MAKAWQVLLQFLLLGCTSFGGPVAHLAYFRERFVTRLGWLSDERYSQLVALSQFLPGPGSSQVGFAIGYHRAGLVGGLAAFLGFTTPSVVIMYALFVWGEQQSPVLMAVTAGLKLLAVVVVLDAVVAMGRSFCTGIFYWLIALYASILMALIGGFWVQCAVLVAGAVLGALKCQVDIRITPVALRPKRFILLVVASGLVLLPLVANQHEVLSLINSFYQSGSLVFGGGHVVLPLLQTAIGERISSEQFLLAYSVAQAIPGPMFSIAAFLGAALYTPTPWLGALLAVAAIFLPGLLLMLALQASWQQLMAYPRLAAASAGVNAAVVGLLLAALYKPVLVSSISSFSTAAAALAGYWVLVKYRPPILVLVIAFASFGYVQAI